MKKAPLSGNCVTDGESRLLSVGMESIAISSIPWPLPRGRLFVDEKPTAYADITRELLRAGKKLRAEERAPWLILCHEPPGGTPLTAGYTAPEADFTRRLIEAAEPDFSLHGHIHDAPTSTGGSWIWRIGKTVCFNAGQSCDGRLPRYILLHWRGYGDWNAVWHGDGRILHADSRHFRAERD